MSQPYPLNRPRHQGPYEVFATMQARFVMLVSFIRRSFFHWRVGVIGFVVMAGLVGAMAYFYKPAYQSETVVFYQQAPAPESLRHEQDQLDAEQLHSRVVSRERLEALIRDLDIEHKTVAEHGMAVAVEDVRQQLKFKALSKSTFRISYLASSPEEARDVTKWLADALVREDGERRRAQARRAKEFLDEELKRAEQVLAARQDALGHFIGDHPEFSVNAKDELLPPADPRRPGMPARRSRRAAGASPGAPDAGMPGPDPQLVAEREAAVQKLTEASRELAKLQAQYTDKHPAVSAAEARVRAAESRVSETTSALSRATPAPPPPAPPEPPPPAATPHPIQYQPKAVQSVPSPTPPASLGAVEAEYMRLERAVDDARSRAEKLATESFLAEVASRSHDEGYDARVIVLDPAHLPAAPLRSRLIFLVTGLPLALIFAALLMMAWLIFDDRIYEAKDFERRGVDLLVTPIPRG